MLSHFSYYSDYKIFAVYRYRIQNHCRIQIQNSKSLPYIDIEFKIIAVYRYRIQQHFSLSQKRTVWIESENKSQVVECIVLKRHALFSTLFHYYHYYYYFYSHTRNRFHRVTFKLENIHWPKFCIITFLIFHYAELGNGECRLRIGLFTSFKNKFQ